MTATIEITPVIVVVVVTVMGIIGYLLKTQFNDLKKDVEDAVSKAEKAGTIKTELRKEFATALTELEVSTVENLYEFKLKVATENIDNDEFIRAINAVSGEIKVISGKLDRIIGVPVQKDAES